MIAASQVHQSIKSHQVGAELGTTQKSSGSGSEIRGKVQNAESSAASTSGHEAGTVGVGGSAAAAWPERLRATEHLRRLNTGALKSGGNL